MAALAMQHGPLDLILQRVLVKLVPADVQAQKLLDAPSGQKDTGAGMPRKEPGPRLNCGGGR